MSGVEFEPTIPVFEQTKMVHALDRTAIALDPRYIVMLIVSQNKQWPHKWKLFQKYVQ
jgi:hypothetical protein